MCGENETDVADGYRVRGSPPRVRGKRDGSLSRSAPGGITPACAGKTTAQACKDTPTRDHPRVCGENQSADCVLLAILGSPPRVRGKLAAGLKRKGYKGITPACAGKTRTMPLLVRKAGDHPRVCGENPSPSSPYTITQGSPPRVRGKLLIGLLSFHHVGITPACAGKTGSPKSGYPHAEDHPRVCGENIVKHG